MHVLVGEYEEKRRFGRTAYRKEDRIEVDLKRNVRLSWLGSDDGLLCRRQRTFSLRNTRGIFCLSERLIFIASQEVWKFCLVKRGLY